MSTTEGNSRLAVLDRQGRTRLSLSVLERRLTGYVPVQRERDSSGSSGPPP